MLILGFDRMRCLAVQITLHYTIISLSLSIFLSNSIRMTKSGSFHGRRANLEYVRHGKDLSESEKGAMGSGMGHDLGSGSAACRFCERDELFDELWLSLFDLHGDGKAVCVPSESSSVFCLLSSPSPTPSWIITDFWYLPKCPSQILHAPWVVSSLDRLNHEKYSRRVHRYISWMIRDFRYWLP